MKSLQTITLSTETYVLALVCFADLCLTAILLACGQMTEANPLLRYWLNCGGLGALCLVKLASFLFPLALAEWYRQHRPEFITSLLRVVLTLYIVGYVAGVAVVNHGFSPF